MVDDTSSGALNAGYYLAKSTQHKPRQWIGSMGMKYVQALRRYITINTDK